MNTNSITNNPNIKTLWLNNLEGFNGDVSQLPQLDPSLQTAIKNFTTPPSLADLISLIDSRSTSHVRVGTPEDPFLPKRSFNDFFRDCCLRRLLPVIDDFSKIIERLIHSIRNMLDSRAPAYRLLGGGAKSSSALDT